MLILREVLGFSAGEGAGALGTTPASVYSALQRACKAAAPRGGRRLDPTAAMSRCVRPGRVAYAASE